MPDSKFLTYDRAKVKRDKESAVDKDVKVYEDFYRGDHWQAGAGWVGPWPQGASQKDGAEQVSELIRRGFVSRNMIKETVDRHKAGLCGVRPNFRFVPIEQAEGGTEVPEDLKKKIEVASDLLDRWWNERNALGLFGETVSRVLYAGAAALRLFIPRGMLSEVAATEEGGKPRKLVPKFPLGENVLRLVYLESPDVGQFARIQDNSTMQSALVYQWEEKSENANEGFIEIHFVRDPLVDPRKTVVKVFKENGDETWEMEVDLGGKLLMHEIVRDPLITPQIVSNQKSLNLSLTMMRENVVYGGFLERVITNAEIPGKWETDEKTGEKKFVADGWKIGAGYTSFLMSKTVQDGEGNEVPLPTSVSYRDPVDVTTFKDSIDVAEAMILAEAKQSYVRIEREGNVSGASRMQSRYDYGLSLGESKPVVDDLMKWLVETLLVLEATFAQEPDAFKGIRVVVDTKPNVGPLTAEERGMIREDFKAGLISWQLAATMLGVEDPSSEREQIVKEQKESPRPLSETVAAGYGLDEEQFPELDEKYGFKKRDEAQIKALKQQRLDQEKALNDARARSFDPGAVGDDE